MDDQTAAYREARKAIERSRAVRVFLFHLAAYIVGTHISQISRVGAS